jgi:GNAT superfamily N-acetyltransferase
MWKRGEYEISTEPGRLDLAMIHSWLSTSSYWAQGRPIDVVRRSIEHSLPFGIYQGTQQVGFARVVTDFATFAWLADVFILDHHRGRGLSKWLVETIITHPDLQGLRRFVLATQDAHSLYAQFGFTPLRAPDRWMERSTGH